MWNITLKTHADMDWPLDRNDFDGSRACAFGLSDVVGRYMLLTTYMIVTKIAYTLDTSLPLCPTRSYKLY